ncbi:hypothetical protein NDU88_001071 [Pleurodeles waltl]|uniref:Uncharacterized protein n=1 Tax=Pleurodeles waltl TaxID=8319 RepID=A0AAV7ND66_PLEWA|nr:hypothetical protein NDU88_001071 [Pleurodeles waltl]
MPQDIINEFAAFYRMLYMLEVAADCTDLEAFYDSIHRPRLNDFSRALLDGEISKTEIAQGISGLPCQKAPGEDGFPAEFYKWTAGEVVNTLYDAFHDAEE